MQRRGQNISKEPHHSRHRYEDPNHHFTDWVNRLGLEKTWFGRMLLVLEERFQIRFVASLFLFGFVLAYVMAFEIETPLDYKLGDIAPANVTTPISFQMTDEITTEEKRQNSEKKILPVFDFETVLFEKVSSNVYRAFRMMRNKIKAEKMPKSLSQREEWAKDFFRYKSEFDKEIGAVIPDYLFEWLINKRFSVRIENVLVRILDEWFDEKIADSPDRFVPESTEMVSLRHIHKSGNGKEVILSKSEILDIQNEDHFLLKEIFGIEKLSVNDQETISALAKSLLVPNVTPNKQESAFRKQQARDSVAPVIQSFRKNQTVINEGVVVQATHLAIFKEIEAYKADRRTDVIALVSAFLFVILMIIFYSYLRRYSVNKVKIFSTDLKVMALILLGEVVLTKLFLFVTEGAFLAKFGSLVPSGFFTYLAPIAAGPMLVGLLVVSGEVVFMYTLFLSIVMGLMMEMNFSYAVVVLASGVAGARGIYGVKTRNDLYWAGFRAGVVTSMVAALIVVIERFGQNNFVRDLVFIIPAGFFSGIFSSMAALTFVPLLESIFNYTTDVKLLELSNLNHPLLKEMIVKAPGTYHHSMMVGSMVEAAAEEIEANPLLGKVMSYYHDIGKMEHANYFIENQKSGQNPHDHISPYMSRTLLIAHVKDGVDLGYKHKLGKPIIDGVLQHHGTTLISFFFNKAQEALSSDGVELREEEFRYPGPKPQFREAALCMLADSIEAASRSLDEPTPVRLQNIVRNIIQKKFMDGQLNECNLTLKDLTRVENAFIKILLGIYHQRIDYPRSAGGGLGDLVPKTGKLQSQKG